MLGLGACIPQSPWQQLPGLDTVRSPQIGSFFGGSDGAGFLLFEPTNDTKQEQLLAFTFYLYQCAHVSVCVYLCVNLVRWRDVCKALDEVGPLHLGQGRVEGMLTLAGHDQTHQAGVNHHLVHHIRQTCSHKQTRLLLHT